MSRIRLSEKHITDGPIFVDLPGNDFIGECRPVADGGKGNITVLDGIGFRMSCDQQELGICKLSVDGDFCPYFPEVRSSDGTKADDLKKRLPGIKFDSFIADQSDKGNYFSEQCTHLITPETNHITTVVAALVLERNENGKVVKVERGCARASVGRCDLLKSDCLEHASPLSTFYGNIRARLEKKKQD